MSAVILALFFFASCQKQDTNNEPSSNASQSTLKSNSIYTSLGSAQIFREINGDLLIKNIGASGDDGLEIDVSNICSGDFLMDTLFFSNDSDFVALTALNTKGEIIATIGANYVNQEHQVFYYFDDSLAQNVSIQILDNEKLKYSSVLEAKAFPWWPLVMAFMQRLTDFHLETETNINFLTGEASYTTSMDISMGGSANSNDGGDVNTPSGTFHADRIRIVIEDHKYPFDKIQLRTSGVSTITISEDDLYRGDCR